MAITLGDAIEETERRVDPMQRDITLQLAAPFTAGATTMQFTDLSANTLNITSVIPGVYVSVDLEDFLVTSQPSNGSFNVIPGSRGSFQANHLSGATVHVRRRFTSWDIFTALNDDLNDLEGLGLYNLAQLAISYNPVFQAYDLTDINGGGPITNFIELIALRYKTPLPDRIYHAIPIRTAEVVPLGSTTLDTNFPSGYQLILKSEVGWPGLPIDVIFKQGFSPFTNTTTPATDLAQVITTTTHLASYMTPLLSLGAMIRLVGPREIARNQQYNQQDSRLAPEVPPGAVSGSINAAMRERIERIESAKNLLKRQVGQFRK